MRLTEARSQFLTGEVVEVVVAACQAVTTGYYSSCVLSSVVFYSTTDVHTVASLLKLYIRELPEPIIPFCKYTLFLSCAQLLTKDKEVVMKSLLVVIDKS